MVIKANSTFVLVTHQCPVNVLKFCDALLRHPVGNMNKYEKVPAAVSGGRRVEPFSDYQAVFTPNQPLCYKPAVGG